MTLRDLMQRQAGAILSNPAYHGEQVTRRRKGAADLVLNVTINRNGRGFGQDGVRVAYERAEVFVPAGGDVISGDELLFAIVVGGAETANRVDGLLRRSHAGSVWEVIR